MTRIRPTIAALATAAALFVGPGWAQAPSDAAAAAQAKVPSLWKPIAEDGIHDPTSPALPLLQEPGEALSVLPRDAEGNRVNWVTALQEGHIAPRTNIYPETKIQVLDLDIVFPDTSSMHMVTFPHRQHTEWLDCSNCHDRIFKEKTGANPVNMLKILNGEYCGQCHGAVSFPLTECGRCHNTPRPPVKIIQPPPE